MSLKTPPTAILFDWDNTLVDTWPTIHGAMSVVFEKRGLTPWTLEEVKDRCHASGREAFPKLFPNDWQSAMDDFYGYISEQHLNNIVLLPFAKELLDHVTHKGVPIGIVSNKTKPFLVKEVEHFGFSKHFGDVVVGAGDALRDKPDAAPLKLALEQFGIVPSTNVWMIGDTPADWNAARATGVLAIGVGGDTEDDTSLGHDGPDIMFKDLKPIYDVLQNLL